MPRLGTRPAAEVAIDGEKLNLREAARILRRDLRIARTIIVACDDFLRLGRVQKLEIGFRHRQRSIFPGIAVHHRSEEHTSELQSLMRISYAVFCLKKKTKPTTNDSTMIS